MTVETAKTHRAAARRFHAMGINILPLDAQKQPMRTGVAPNGKPMLFQWDAWQTERQTDQDLAAILRPGYWVDVSGIGAICGPVSGGLVCVDFDLPTKRTGSLPWQIVTRFLDLAGLPHDYAWIVDTPRGGFHVWMRCPDLAIDKGKLDAPAAGLPDGYHIEVRYTAHYAALPGSVCDMTQTTPLEGYSAVEPRVAYQWKGDKPDALPATITAAALLPSWAAVTEATTKTATTTPTKTAAAAAATHEGGGTRRAAAALAAEVQAVRGAVEGTRNDSLNTAAFNLGQLVGAGELDAATVESELTAAALAAGLGEGESLRTIGGGMRAGAAKSHERQPPRTQAGAAESPYDGFGESAVDAAVFRDALPEIVVNKRQDRDVRADAMAALLSANAKDPAEPLVLMRAGVPVCLDIDETGQRRARAVGVDKMQVLLADCATWVMETKDEQRIPVDCGEKYARRVLAALDGAGLPALAAVSAAPVFAADGALATHYGYSARTKVFLDAHIDITRMSREQALNVLLGSDGALADFDFAAESDSANALAAMLTPFCRNLFDGQSPMFIVEAPSHGDGKSLLMRTLAAPSTGGRVALTPEPTPGEWSRFILAKAVEAPSVVMIDNIARQKLDSSVLASALTTSRVSGRVLGQTAIVDGELSCTWFASGARPQFSQELARRVLTISLKSAKERRGRPYLRTNPESWVLANRAQVVSACTSIIQDWIEAGRPLWKDRTMPSFDDWAAVLGGILHHAGVNGFLQQTVDVDPDTAAWDDFVSAWAETFKDAKVTTGDLFTLASYREGRGDDGFAIFEGLGLLDELLDARSERGRLTQLGMLLGQRVGAIIAGFRIVDAGRNREKLRQFHLARIAPPPTAGEPLGGVKCAGPAVPQNQGTAQGTAAKMEIQTPQNAVPWDLFPLSHAGSESVIDHGDHDHDIGYDRPKGTQGTAIGADRISKNAAVPCAVPQNQGTAGAALPAALQALDGAVVLLNGAQWGEAWDIAAAHGYDVITTPAAGGQRLSFRKSARPIDGAAAVAELGL